MYAFIEPFCYLNLGKLALLHSYSLVFLRRPLHTPLSDSLKWAIYSTLNSIKLYVISYCMPEMRLLVVQISS